MQQPKLPLFSPHIQNLNKKTMTVKIGMDKKSISVITNRTREYKAVPQVLRPAMEGISDYFRQTMIPEVFRKEGPGWAPLARRTKRERTAQGFGAEHPILIRTRDLYQELTDKAHPKHIEIIRVGKKARIEIGGSSQKFIQNQLGKKEQRLPARPMIPGTGGLDLKERDKREMARIIQKAYKNYMNRPK